jgi:spore photoproduct lyase
LAQQIRQLDFLPTSAEADHGYVPRTVEHFHPDRIILTKGCRGSNARVAFVEAICRAYPAAEVIERLDTSHAQVDLGIDEPLALHRCGKRTLVLGEHKSPVRFSDERSNCCPNYWHFSPYGFCPYGCVYCYLAGTRGVWFSPTVKIFVNLDEMVARVDKIANRAGSPTAFYLGKLQDGLVLDPLTGYSRRIISFFGQHRWARLVLLTKSSDVDNLMGLPHQGNVILSWSLSSENVWQRFEPGTPSPAERLNAMRRCAKAGYRLRAVLMPVLPIGDWRADYESLLDELLTIAPLERITLGSLCSFPSALRLTDAKLGRANPIRECLSGSGQSADGRYRFDPACRIEVYRHLLNQIRLRSPSLRSLQQVPPAVAVPHQAERSRHLGRCDPGVPRPLPVQPPGRQDPRPSLAVLSGYLADHRYPCGCHTYQDELTCSQMSVYPPGFVEEPA